MQIYLDPTSQALSCDNGRIHVQLYIMFLSFGHSSTLNFCLMYCIDLLFHNLWVNLKRNGCLTIGLDIINTMAKVIVAVVMRIGIAKALTIGYNLCILVVMFFGFLSVPVWF